MDNNLNITSLDALKSYSQGSIVELPPFAEDMPFVARIKRPSMLALVKSGKIPNELIESANELFMGKVGSKNSSSSGTNMTEIFGVFEAICEACFVEPSWSQLKEAGIELTDDQYTFIFNYTQSGVKALKSFREVPKDNRPDISGKNVQQNSK